MRILIFDSINIISILNIQIMKPLFCFFLSIISFSCLAQKYIPKSKIQALEMEELADMMTGTFSSAEQAANDSLYYDINLVMHPIWENDENYKWLYVEQAVTASLEKPYRQRVYRLQKIDKNVIESRVFTLKNPEDYIHAWDNPALFESINSNSLVLREGCSVFLSGSSDGCYSGSTNEKDCGSTLRGASYATSIVEICPEQIVSWDQGWDSEDNQVWGAEKAGYIFKRKDK